MSVNLQFEINPTSGEVTVKALTGTFEEDAPVIQALLDDLGLGGIKFEIVTPTESHRHTPEEIALHNATHHTH